MEASINLAEVLVAHKEWLNSNGGKGARADLAGANLADANLAGADLADAYLEDANLEDANLAGADLARAYLAGAYLAGADLAGANLADANLADAYLEDANLAGADLADAYLARADLAGANLADANLAGADLEDANLAGADLADAYLARAYLAGAYLAGAYLADANLAGANLAGARNVPAGMTAVATSSSEPYDRSKSVDYAARAARYRERHPEVPVVPRLDVEILRALESGGTLNMRNWHTCETTHCRAGWAITLAGEAGKKLECEYGSERAGGMIYKASTGRIPHFFASNERALEDIRECARGQQ